jgi:exodeoxyribonuclease-3
LKLLTYNIRFGGTGRVEALAAVVNGCAPDVVVLEEATRPDVVEKLAAATGMATWATLPGHSVGFMSRLEIASHRWHRTPPTRRRFLEIVPAGGGVHIYGVHLTAVHSNWTERVRVRELTAVLSGIRREERGFHVVLGDFNTLAPGATLDLRRLPPRLRLVVWLTGRRIRWRTIQMMLDASYVDVYRSLHPEKPGFTFPTWGPNIRLDYVFAPQAWAAQLRSCEVVDGPGAREASDHLPLMTELDVATASATGGVSEGASAA